MDGFLVVARFGVDDLPIGLFSTLEAAREFVADEPDPNDFIADAFDTCIDDLICYRIVGFIRGEPVEEYATELVG